MVELTPENFDKLASDVNALSEGVHVLSGDLREIKGSIDGFKHSQSTLTWAVGIVGGLFVAALAYGGAQIGGLESRVDSLGSRVDGVITELTGVQRELGGVQGGLGVINQKLDALDEIRDRIKDLASISPSTGDGGGEIEESRISDLQIDQSGALKSGGVVYRGEVDPIEFAELVKLISEHQPNVRIVGAESVGGATSLAYVPTTSNWAWGGSAQVELDESQRMELMRKLELIRGLQPTVAGAIPYARLVESNTLAEFSAEISAMYEKLGIVVIRTDDSILREIAAQHGVDFQPLR